MIKKKNQVCVCVCPQVYRKQNVQKLLVDSHKVQNCMEKGEKGWVMLIILSFAATETPPITHDWIGTVI